MLVPPSAALSALSVGGALSAQGAPGAVPRSTPVSPYSVSLAACDVGDYAVTLFAAVAATQSRGTPPLEARAIWLDARTVRWPGTHTVPAGDRFALYTSATAALVAAPGEPVRGADRRFRLTVRRAPLAPAVRRRFAYVDSGVTLTTSAADTELRSGHRQQQWLVQEDAQGRVQRVTALQSSGALDDLYAAAEPLTDLGVQVTGAQAQWLLWAPSAQQVSVCVHPAADAPASRVVPLTLNARTGAWRATLAGDLRGQYYRYLVDVVVPGVGVVRNRVTDPYSVGLSANSTHSYIADLAAPALAPQGWRAHRDSVRRGASASRVKSPVDLVIYELHVRNFSIGDSTAPASHRGKYLAFTDSGSTGVAQLRALSRAGVTDVHLLPVFDLATIPEIDCRTPSPRGAPDSDAQQATVMAVAAQDCFNWGYDPYHYTVPEGSYASDPRDAAVRIREFRRMVMALNALGLRVGMDVVYNHTTASGQQRTAVLDRIVPGYYHRLDAAGKVTTSTCCANTATEHRMMAKLMVESVATWAKQYGIESFRFDLMGHQPRAAMQRVQLAANAAAGRHVHLIGEGWNFGEVADGQRFVQASQLSLNGSGIATFSDRARDAVRGGGAGDNGGAQIARQGYINGLVYASNDSAPRDLAADALPNAADMVRVGLAGSLRSYRLHTAAGRVQRLDQLVYGGNQPAGYVTSPAEVVNYVENHDNQTLFDLNVFKLPRATSRDDRARVQLLGSAVVAFSQGIAYLHAGQELLRSKSLDRNSFDSGDWFNQLDWTLTDNGFGQGLPPRADNQQSWPLMRPLLGDSTIAPTPALLRFTRDATLDLLRIRNSSTLFRMRTAADIGARLTFHNTGPEQVATVIVGHLNGVGYAGAQYREVLYAINVDTVAQAIALPTLTRVPFVLHPVHQRAGAADTRAVLSVWNADAGVLYVPARSAVVWVRR